MLNYYKKAGKTTIFLNKIFFILSTEEQSEECEKCTNSGCRKIILH